MIRRNLPILLFLTLFLGLLVILLGNVSPKILPIKKESKGEVAPLEVLFHGRMEPLSISNLYVYENTAERNVEDLLTYLQGRLSSLHYLYEKTYPRKKRPNEDLFIGLWVEIDQDGLFKNARIQFNNAKETALNKPLIQLVEKYWRYKRANQGSTTILIPLQWHAKYSRALLSDAQLK